MEKVGRRRARENAFLMVFEINFLESFDPDTVLADASECFDLTENDYTKQLFYGVCDHLDEIDAMIDSQPKQWKNERLSKVSFAVLRLAVCEMVFLRENAVAVIINEAVEIAKKYEGEKAGAFVNGVLGNLAKTLENKE